MSPAVHAADLALLANRPTLPTAARIAVRLAVVVVAWDTRARSRRALGKLAPDMLRDIGLTPREAQDEAAQPFWKA